MKKKKETLAVFDFGEEPFDVSIVDRDGFIFNVLSSDGDVHLGGDDVDDVVANTFLAKVHPQLVARRATKESELFRNLLVHGNAKKPFKQKV